MKLDTLLGPYLYQYKKLNLPGIGTFEADISTVAPEDNDKHHTPVQGITFKSFSSPEPDPELIEFIKKHTGKMKPLAMADLESYLMLVKQFLNIGKPFYIEGIGTLQKVTDGTFKFTPGEYISSRLEGNAPEYSTAHRKPSGENKDTDLNTSGGTGRKAIVVLVVIATIAVIGLGGYYFYHMNANKQKEEVSPADTLVTPLPDTTHTIIPAKPDSTTLMKDTAAAKRADTAAKTQSPLRETLLRPDTTSKPVKHIKTTKAVKPAVRDTALVVNDSTTSP